MNLIDELIARATEKYPVGTIFNSLGGNQGVKVQLGDIFRSGDGNRRGMISLFSMSNSYKGWVIETSNPNKWAEIISKPKPIVINNYDIW